MKINILNINSDIDAFLSEPLSYRVSLITYDGENIELVREYFRVGFNNGEQWDKPFFNFFTRLKPSVKVSIITRKLNDKKYLKKLEKIVIDEFIKSCDNETNILKNHLIIETKRVNDNIKRYKNIIKFMDKKFKRKDKIEKILNNG